MPTHTHLTDDGREIDVDYEIHGAYERQTRHHPGATPDIELLSDLPDDVDADDVREAIWETVEREPDRDPDPDAHGPPPGAHDIPPGYNGR